MPYGYGVSTREFLGRPMRWHGGNVDSHSTLVAYLPAEDLGVVLLTAKGFVWLTEPLPADGARDRFEVDWGEMRSYARALVPSTD